MRIMEIRYRRVANLGHYETATIEATASIDESEDPHAAMQDLRDWVYSELGADMQKKSGADHSAR